MKTVVGVLMLITAMWLGRAGICLPVIAVSQQPLSTVPETADRGTRPFARTPRRETPGHDGGSAKHDDASSTDFFETRISARSRRTMLFVS